MISTASSQGPAQPVYVLRGHASQLHALRFFRNNTRLLTADADGWAVVWKIASRRPIAVWNAHDGTILGVDVWEDDKIVTHGRDNKLFVWKLTEEDEDSLDMQLPVENEVVGHRKPWLLYSLDVNALNFCAFSMCPYVHPGEDARAGCREDKSLLVAVPSSLDSDSIDVYQLPSTSRITAAVGHGSETKTGMAMTTKLLYIHSKLTLLAGFESGHARIYQLSTSLIDSSTIIPSSSWKCIYSHKPHTQPILSLDYITVRSVFITSSADAVIAEHHVPLPSENLIVEGNSKVNNTHHAGQQSLCIRSDGRIFATAGWDSRIRVYSTKTLKELAVLKWHREGCYAVAFAEITGNVEKISIEQAQVQEISESTDIATVGRSTEMISAEQRRSEKAATMHWLAAGSKDGKVSLWEIY